MHGVIITVAAILGIFGIAYTYLTGRHRERIAMIERGVDASIFAGEPKQTSYTLKFGMLFVGIALGIICYGIITKYYFVNDFTVVGMIFLFGGISLVCNFLVERNLDKKDRDTSGN